MKKHSDQVNISSSQTTQGTEGALCGQPSDGKAFEKRAAEGHDVRRLELYDGEQLCGTIYADFTTQEVWAEQAGVCLDAAFGVELPLSWAGFRAFGRKRCLPGVEPDLQGYLASLGMDDNSPVIVLQKDPEQVNKNRQWIKLEVLRGPALTGVGQTD